MPDDRDQDLLTILADTLLYQIRRIRDITLRDLENGQTVDTLIRHTMDEMGEFCQAVTSEMGEKPRDLKETSAQEAGDLAICALALFFARGGAIGQLAELLPVKLDKWEGTQNRQAAVPQPVSETPLDGPPYDEPYTYPTALDCMSAGKHMTAKDGQGYCAFCGYTDE